MPHLRIDYSVNLAPLPAWSNLFAELHELLSRVADIDPANCKSRAYPAEHFLVGAPGSAEAFVHLDLRLLEGRDAELLQRIGREALACLERACQSASAEQPLQLTVALGELQRARYFKSSSG